MIVGHAKIVFVHNNSECYHQQLKYEVKVVLNWTEQQLNLLQILQTI